MTDESDDNGYAAPVRYSGDFEDVLKKYFTKKTSFHSEITKPANAKKHIFLYFVDKDNKLFTFVDLFFENGEIGLQDLKTGRYFRCLARIRGSYTRDVETWERFLVTPPLEEASIRISLPAFLDVDL